MFINKYVLIVRINICFISVCKIINLYFKVKCARFTPVGGFFNNKADIYAEMIIDGNPSRKTEIIRKTWSPVWNENFDMYNLLRKKSFHLILKFLLNNI
jgi:Ca2+-dependent lipid-binding protein